MEKQWKTEITLHLHFENAMCPVLHVKNNTFAFFAESLMFPKWMTFTHATWVKSEKLKLKNKLHLLFHF